MRKILSLFLALALALGTPGIAFAETSKSDYIVNGTIAERGISASLAPSVDATSCVLKDDNGKLLFLRNADEEVKIASLTKIMTFIVAAENASNDEMVTVSENAAWTTGSTASLQTGDTMTLENLFKGLMIPSGNDAAVAIAEFIGAKISGSSDQTAAYDAFVEAMNSKATSLGCTHTKFTNPHGLDDGEFESDSHSCANDLMLMIECAMQNETFRAIVAGGSDNMELERDGAQTTVALETTDTLLGSYDGACGIKTGTTDLAGYCFAGACEREGDMIYSVVLGSSDDAARFESTEELFDWYYGGYVDYKLNNTDDGVMAQVSDASWIDKTVPATIENKDETVRIFKFDGNVSQEVTFDDVSGDVKAGDKVGSISYIQNNEVIATKDLVAAEDVAAPDFFETISIWFTRLIHNFTGEKSQADSYILNDTPLVLEY